MGNKVLEVCVGAAVAGVLLMGGTARAAGPLLPGQIVVADSAEVRRLNADGSVQDVLWNSGATSVAIADKNTLFAVTSVGGVWKIDVAAEQATELTNFSYPEVPSAVAIEPDGTVLVRVGDHSGGSWPTLGSLVRVDPNTGDKDYLVTGDAALSGDGSHSGLSLKVASNGDIYANSSSFSSYLNSTVHIDPVSGAIGLAFGTQIGFGAPLDINRVSGELFVVEGALDLIRILPDASSGTPEGEASFFWPIALTPNGEVLQYGAEANDVEVMQYACSDGLDNDGDGLTDFPNDPNCLSVSDNREKGGCGASISPVATFGTPLMVFVMLFGLWAGRQHLLRRCVTR